MSINLMNELSFRLEINRAIEGQIRLILETCLISAQKNAPPSMTFI